MSELLNNYALVAVIVASHTLAAARFVRVFNRGQLPNAVDFASLSCLLFNGLPLLCEVLITPLDNRFFTSLLHEDPLTMWSLGLLIAAIPWLLRLGDARPVSIRPNCAAMASAVAPALQVPFYLAAATIAVGAAAYGYSVAQSGDNVWTVRRHLGEVWGPWIVCLYLPLHILAFFVTLRDSRSGFGRIFIAFLVVATIFAVLPIGQRTNVLLPGLILCIFGFRANTTTLALIAGSLLLGAAVVLPLFKWQSASEKQTLAERMSSIVAGDLARTPVLLQSMKVSDPLGTQVMPYPGAGYVYSALFFVPRSWFPEKGYSTAAGFTAAVVGDNPERIGWGFGLGLTEEIMLNFGWLACIPGLLLWGSLFGLLDRAVQRIPSLAVPVSLGAMWSLGYHLPALLLTFGAMAGCVGLLHLLFVGQASPRQRASCARAEPMIVESCLKHGMRATGGNPVPP